MEPAKSRPIIEVKNFTAAYGDTIILKDVNFSVCQGEIFAILGGSGCGKSTLLKHMIGLYPPTTGEILIDGENLVDAFGKERRRILQKFGVTYQSGALFGSMTLAENITLPIEEFTRLPQAARDLIASMKLGLVGLEKDALSLPSEVSGGMQKRAAIARAMALDPIVLFLDEPSAGLDPVTSASLDELILRLNQNLGVTFVIVTHELPSVFAVANRVIMLDKEMKGIRAEGTPKELKDNTSDPVVHAFFHREPISS